MCYDETYGETIRTQCPATCGLCTCEDRAVEFGPFSLPCSLFSSFSFFCWLPIVGDIVSESCPLTCSACSQAIAANSENRPAQTLAPFLGACEEGAEEKDLSIGGNVFRGTCSTFSPWCSESIVGEACPITCGLCVKEGCEDDPNYLTETSYGSLTCTDWRNYQCSPEVIDHCPSACQKPECTR